MSVWLTRSSDKDRDYIVLKHTLRGANYSVNGVKFRNGYAVVEKGSKIHRDLKNIPVLRAAEEYPLIFLRKLPFITRPLDVKLVYGADVYTKYLKQLDVEVKKEGEAKQAELEIKKIEAEVKHVEEHNLCSHRTVHNELCKESALDESPSGYCLRHILDEPKLQELGIEVPRFIPKKDKQLYREKVSSLLRSAKKQGKF